MPRPRLSVLQDYRRDQMSIVILHLRALRYPSLYRQSTTDTTGNGQVISLSIFVPTPTTEETLTRSEKVTRRCGQRGLPWGVRTMSRLVSDDTSKLKSLFQIVDEYPTYLQLDTFFRNIGITSTPKCQVRVLFWYYVLSVRSVVFR